VRIDDDSISRNHAVLHVDGESIHIEDCGSSNGTLIGGRRITRLSRVPVEPRLTITMGEAMLVLHMGQAAAPESMVPSAVPEPRETSMERLYKLIELVAQSSISVLLAGETGVGKEVIAERVHQRSPRKSKPLVKLNCAALPDQLLESELFGYEKGAFTGAVSAKTGLLEAAQGGTVFLDELGEMPLSTQAKLLRALECREVQPLGALKPRPIDVRFVAATNRDLETLSARGEFRRDLYFRLNGISIHIPPLRERTGEIPGLVDHFLTALERTGVQRCKISTAAMARLKAHSWPGNIRELRNVVERAAVLSGGQAIVPDGRGRGGGRSACRGVAGARAAARHRRARAVRRQPDRGGEGARHLAPHARVPPLGLRHHAAAQAALRGVRPSRRDCAPRASRGRAPRRPSR
jgi:hypothetical protein